MSEPLEDGLLTAYLLGRLSPDEEDRVEGEYFHAGEPYDRLQAAEDDLIDAYVAGRLEQDDVRRFEEHFLASPGRRERVAFAKALRTLVTRKAGPAAPRLPSFLLPLAAVLPFALAAGWLLVSGREMRTELARHREERSAHERESAEHRERIASLEEQLARVRSISGVALWPLAPGFERDSTPPAALTVPPDAMVVCLRLALGPAAPRGPFVARVETAEGGVVAALHGLGVRDNRAVDVMVPAASLAPGTYVVILEAGRPPGRVDTYHLRVAAP